VSLEEGLDLPESDIAWLRAALATATYPTVIFLHAPIDGQSMIGNYYFEGRPDLSGYSNGATARSVIEASAKVVLVLAGHVHWNSGTTIDGVHYRTLACLTDTFQAGVDASRTWAVLDLDASSISLDVRGAEPMRWSAPPRPDHAHWKKPMASEAFDKRMRTLWSGGQVAP
jgi:Icc protein